MKSYLCLIVLFVAWNQPIQASIVKPLPPRGVIFDHLPPPDINKPDISILTPSQPALNKDSSDESSSEENGKHECYRECNTNEEPKTCYYKFTLEWYQTMSKACFNCPFNASDCNSKDCIPGSGEIRPITVINRMMPAPKIEVCQYDTVVIDLENQLLSSGTTLHWHGMHQKATPYMDGAPFVTQCPIQPENSFRYKFQATESGTHFYHSHIGLQRADGAFGPFIVRRPREVEPNTELYDFDISEHTIIVNDWINITTIDYFNLYYHGSGGNNPSSLLFNGAGRFPIQQGDRTASLKPATFEVVQGAKYRFRIINAEFTGCPVELSVDNHNLTVIAADGSDVVPVEAASLVSFAGERYDFVINADKPIDNYWIKLRGLLGCVQDVGTRQVAVLHYTGAQDEQPGNEPVYERPPGIVVNPENRGEGTAENSVTVSQMRAYEGYDETLKAEPDHKIFVGYDLFAKNNSVFHREPYTYNKVDAVFRKRSPQLNHISMEMPKSPLLVTRPSFDHFCNEDTVSDTCVTEFCQCPHVISVELNSIVEVVLVDEGHDVTANHPFHLHGHVFRVLSQIKLGERTTVEEVKQLDREGKLKRNFDNPPFKDTVAVPDGGYTVFRFKAYNPGYWLFHCHIEFHADVGMAMVVKVGEHEDMLPVPADFPSCGNYGVPEE